MFCSAVIVFFVLFFVDETAEKCETTTGRLVMSLWYLYVGGLSSTLVFDEVFG